MEGSNDHSDHLLPDLSVLLGLSIDRWINLFISIGTISSLVYMFQCFHAIFISMPRRLRLPRVDDQDDCPSSPRKYLVVIVGPLLAVSLQTIRLKFEFRLRKNGDMERGLAWDPIDWLIGFFLYGIGVEVIFLLYWAVFPPRTAAQRRLSMSDLSGRDNNHNISASPNPFSPTHLSRLSWFLLYIGSNSLLNFFVNRRDHNYEYYGPMRLTRLPSLYKMDNVSKYDHDLIDMLPRLGCSLDDYSIRRNGLEQPYILVTLEIGWGRKWGCRNPPTSDEQERWNTNWPRVPECTSFLCSSEKPDALHQGRASPCPCYSSEEEARNATWACLNSEYNLSRLRANETFDQEQPPWDDPTWPSVWRYGNCDGRVGTSMEPTYVRKVLFNGQRQQSFGLVCLTFWLLLVMMRGRSYRGR